MRLRSTHRDSSSTQGGQAVVLPLGMLLLKSGQLTQAQLDTIVRRQAQTDRLFGETAVELGFVSQSQIDRAIAEQQSFFLLDEGDSRVDPSVVAAYRPDDALASTARDLRRALATNSGTGGASVKSVAVLGISAPTEVGLLCANLAVCCVQAGYRTLLVDANIDAPLQHGLFRLPNRVGLTSLHARAAKLEDVIQPTAIPLLALLPAGPAVPNALELLERERLFGLLEQVAGDFDIMVVDAGQAAPAEVGVFDGADVAVIVVRQNGSSLREFRDMVDRLDSVNVSTLGSIFVE